MRAVFIIFLAVTTFLSYGQDGTFYTPYNAVGWTNLAFQGTDTAANISTTQQIEHPKSSAFYYDTYSSFTQYSSSLNSWVSLNHYSENAGNVLFTQRFGIALNKAIHLGKHVVWRNALEVCYFTKRIDWNALTFGDQIDPRQGFIYPSTELPRGGSFSNIDFSYGTSFYYKKILFGISAYHLTQPNQSLLWGNSVLPRRLGAQLAYSFDLKKYRLNFQPFTAYFSQGQIGIFSFGMRTCYANKLYFSYTGQLFYQFSTLGLNTFSIGYHFKHIGINYGIAVGKSVKETGAIHQVGLSIAFWKREKSKRYFTQQLGAYSIQ